MLVCRPITRSSDIYGAVASKYSTEAEVESALYVLYSFFVRWRQTEYLEKQSGSGVSLLCEQLKGSFPDAELSVSASDKYRSFFGFHNVGTFY